MSVENKKVFSASEVSLPPQAVFVGEPQPQETIQVSLYLKARSKAVSTGAPSEIAALATLRAKEHAPDIEAIRSFAATYGLAILSIEPVRRLLKLSGTPAQFEKAFGITLGLYRSDGVVFRSHTNPLQLPIALGDVVESVLGLDNRPIAKPRSLLASPNVLTNHLPNEAR